MKTCTKCHTEKDLDDFYLKSGRWGKHQSWCKACTKANGDRLRREAPRVRDLPQSSKAFDRFRRKLAGISPTPDGCLLWPSIHRSGYGQVRISNRDNRSHVVALHISPKGPLPLQHGIDLDIQTRHLCDNRACSNWEHLEIGTRSENMRDMKTSRSYGEQISQLFAGGDWGKQSRERSMSLALDAIYGADAWRKALSALPTKATVEHAPDSSLSRHP